MGSTPRLNLPYPELSDAPDVPADIKHLADTVDPLLDTALAKRVGSTAPLAIRTGFISMTGSGGHAAGSAYVIEVNTGLAAVTAFVATIRARSPLGPGWVAAPGPDTGQETSLTVQTVYGKPGSMYVSFYHPKAVNYTGGYGGAYWIAIGLA